MGEVFAAVQLAGQVTAFVVRLRSYWNQVRDVPADIHHLLREIEALDFILYRIQSDQLRDRRPSDAVFGPFAMDSLRKSHELCRGGISELRGLANDLADEIDKRKGWKKKIGCAKLVLKKEEIKRLRTKLKSAIRMLNLAFTYHNSAMIELQPDIIMARISSAMGPQRPVPTGYPGSGDTYAETKDCRGAQFQNTLSRLYYQSLASSSSWTRYLLGSWESHRRYYNNNGQDSVELRAKYMSPAWSLWLFGSGLDVAYFRFKADWQLTLRPYRRVSSSHDLFVLAAKGDVGGLRDMLAAKEVSVHDRDDLHGQTALHVAAREGRVEVCELLVNSGADPMASSDSTQRPASDICRLLVGKGAMNTLIDDLTVIAPNNIPIDLVQYLQRQMYPPYESIPFSKRFKLAKMFRSGGWLNTPELIRKSLGGPLNKAMTSYKDPKGETLLHQIGRRWATDIGRNTGSFTDECDGASDRTAWRRPFDADSHTHPWRLLLRDVVSANSPLSPADNHGRTPLCTLIQESVFVYSGRDFRLFRSLLKLLNIWLIELHAAGVDLQKYGEQEVALRLRENANRSIHRNSRAPTRVWISKLLGFDIGPRPHDWRFWFEEPTDQLFGQFWSMVDEPPCEEESSEQRDSGFPMPGGWDESGSDADCQSDHDFDADCGSDIDKDVDNGYDPDFDPVERCLEHNANDSCFSCLVSLRSSLALHDILPSHVAFAK